MRESRVETIAVVDPTPPAPTPKGPLARLVDRILELGPVRWLVPILDSYDAAGGSLLASGLAFNSLFAVLPSILLIVAIVGVLLGDPGRLAAIVTSLTVSFPPLAGFFKEALAGFAGGAVTFSVVGIVALVWGASRFYQSLDDAMARIFESEVRRDPFQRGVLGVLSVVLLAAIVGAVIAISHIATSVGADRVPGFDLGVGLLSSTIGALVVSVGLFSGGVAIIYRIVPTNRPAWRMIRRPAIAVGLFAAILTALFTVITPQLVGSLQVYGAFVAVFGAMIWLSFVSQAVLVGATWVHRRDVVAGAPGDRPDRPAQGSPSPPP